MNKNFYFLIFISCLILIPHCASGAVLYFSTSANDYNVNDIFKAEIWLDTKSDIINTVQASIGFDNTNLEILDISQGGSVLTLWPKMPEYSNQTGKIMFIGGVPKGFTGNEKMISIYFKAKQEGSAVVTFLNNANILLNDGRGTKALVIYQNLPLKISPATGPPKNELEKEFGADNIPPESFEILLSRDSSIFSGKYFIVFSTTDKQSGIDHYEIKEGNSAWLVGESPYLLEKQDSDGKIYVKAVDKSGNERIEELQLPGKRFPYWIIIIGLLIIGIILFLALRYGKIFNCLMCFFVFCFLFFVLATHGAQAQSASAYLAPYSGTFFVGNTFDVSIFVNTEGNNINAIEINLKFSPNLLQVTSPTAGSSFISIWADQPAYSNKDGIISFKGGVPAPGIKTSAGLVSTITFRAKAPGIAKISFLDSSKVLLADGKGTDILKNPANGEYNLVLQPPEGPKIYSPTHPSVNTWYKNNNPVFVIEKEQSVANFSYNIDQDPSGVPDNIPKESNNSITINDVDNGIWYFHAKAQKSGIWGGVSHYPVKIDTLSPKPFDIEIESIGSVSDKKFFAYFSAKDSLSGIDHYEVSIANTGDPQALANPFFIEAGSPYQIPQERAGHYTIFVRAYDKAGNFTESQTAMRTFGSFISFTTNGIQIKNFFLPAWAINILIILITAALAFLFYRILRKRNLVKQLKTEVAEAEKEIEDVRRFEKNLQDMRSLEEEARAQSQRLAEKLTENDNAKFKD